MKQLTDFFFDGNLFWKIVVFLWSLLISLFSQTQVNEIQPYGSKNLKLHNEIVKVDSIFFNPYNTYDIKQVYSIIEKKKNKWFITKVISLY